MRRSLILGTVLLLCCPPVHGEPTQTVRLEEYLQQLAQRHDRIIYSADLVTPDLTIRVPTQGEPSIAALRAALPALNLTLSDGPAGRLLIVRARDNPPAPTLRGVVRNTSGLRVAGAQIAAGDAVTLSDEQGRFAIAVPRGKQPTLQVSAKGHVPHRHVIAAGAGSDASALTVVLSALPAPIESVVVSASRRDIAFVQYASSTAYDQQQLTDMPSLAQEPLRATSRLPGSAGGGLSARQHVRGGDDNEQLVSLEGLRLYEPYHLKDFQSPASLINRAAVGKLVYYSGGFPAQFGDRMSSVTAISLRRPEKRRETEIELSTLNTSVLSLGQFGAGRGEWLASLRRGNLDLTLNALDTDFGNPSYNEVLLHGSRELGGTRLGVNALYARDKVSLALPGAETADALYENRYLWLRAQTDWSSSLNSDVLASYTEVNSTRRGSVDIDGVVAGSVDDRRKFRIFGVQQDWRWRVADVLAVYGGFNGRRIDAEYDYASSATAVAPFDAIVGTVPLGTRSARATPNGSQYALYAGARWKWSPRWIVDAALRWDVQTYTTAADDEQVSPRIGLLYQPSPRAALRLSWGRYYQAQENNELQLEDGLTEFFPAQRSEHAIASASLFLSAALTVRAEAYRKSIGSVQPRFENLFDPLVLLPELHPDRVRIDVQRTVVRGAELTLTFEPPTSPVSWWANYAWSRAIDRTPGGMVERSWDQTHALKFGAQWRPGQWTLGLAASVHTGWPRTRLTLVDDAADGGSPQLVVVARNAERWSDFYRIDVRASRNVRLRHGQLTAFLEVSNLTDRDNPCCTDYSLATDANGTALLVADVDSWLPLVPTLGVSWRF